MGTDGKVPIYHCIRCEHEWLGRPVAKRTGKNNKIVGYEFIKPKNCPDRTCKSPYWDKERQNR